MKQLGIHKQRTENPCVPSSILGPATTFIKPVSLKTYGFLFGVVGRRVCGGRLGSPFWGEYVSSQT